ncbi:MAG: ABC transporter ATP-binding protein, partial [Aquiluna sp.]
PATDKETSGAVRRNLEKESARLERQIAKLEAELEALHLELAAADQSDYEALSVLTEKQKDLRSALSENEQSWLEIAEKLQL